MGSKPSIMIIEHIGLSIEGHCNTDLETAHRNRDMNNHWPKVEWGVKKPACAIVGGGPSAKRALSVLKDWEGDIFAVNDMAAYLSDNGIASYLFMIDCSPDPVKTGPLVKGAVLASRCHPNQFIYDDIRVFDVLEDNPEGIPGGPSAPSRGFLLFLKMGYQGVVFFGCDSSFYKEPYANGDKGLHMDKLLVIKAGDKEYITDLPLLMQANYMAPVLNEYKHLAINASGGLLQAFMDHPKEWRVVAVSKGIKEVYGEDGDRMWGKPYHIDRERVYA